MKAVKIQCLAAISMPLKALQTLVKCKELAPENLRRLKASILELGFSAPLFVWKESGRLVLDGAQRMRALQALAEEGYEIPDLPVALVEASSEQEAKTKALAITSQYGDWVRESLADFATDLDPALLQRTVRLVQGDYVVLSGEDGIDGDDICTDPVEVPEITALGDVWELGAHRLACGSSIDPDQVRLSVPDGIVDLVFTDPPYGVDIAKGGKVGGGGREYRAIIGDESTEVARQFYLVCRQAGWRTFILWGGNYFTDFLPPSPCWLVWDKREDTPSNNFSDAELAWTSFTSPARIYRQLWNGLMRRGARKDDGVRRVHPTQKPVQIHCKILEDYTQAGDVVFDGFAGSGSLLIACEKAGRRWRGMELEPHYCDVIVDRYQRWCADNGARCVVRRNGKPWP